MSPDQDLTKQLDRLFPDTADPTLPIQQHLYDCRAKLSDAEGVYRELLDAVARCETDMHAPDEAAQQLAALEAKRTDLLAAGYLKRLVSNTSKLDADIVALQTKLAALRTRAAGAAQARSQLMAQLVTARTAVEELQKAVALANRQLTGRPLTTAEVADMEADAYAQQSRRRAEANSGAFKERVAEREREERVRAEKARQLRQKTDRYTGPVA